MFDKIRLDDDSINMSDLAERVMLGPQQEVLELVEQFNNDFHSDLKITKTFRWSPGIYQKIREIFTSQCLGWDVKTSKISTFFNKIDNGTWRTRRMRSSLNTIDDKLYWLRQDNTSFQDNTELVTEKFSFIKEKVNNELNEAFEGSRINIECFLDKTDYDLDFPMVYIECTIPEGYDMNVYSNDEEGNHLLHTFPYPFEISLLFQIPLSGWINKLCSTPIERINTLGRMYNPRHRAASGQTFSFNQVAKFNSGDLTLSFPFIGSHQVRDRYNYVCLGNMESDLKASLLQCEFDVFALHIKRWASTYVINVTNPMSAINLFFHGKPKADDRLYQIIGVSSTDNCKYAVERNAHVETPYCDSMECQLRDQCDWYINNFNENVLYAKHAYLGLLSELTQDDITLLHRDINIPEWYYHECLRIHNIEPKLLSFMMFYRTTISKVYYDEDPSTIKNPISTLEQYWHIEDIRTEEHCIACINWLFDYLTQCMDEEAFTFASLNIDFQALNNHFGWIVEKEETKGQMPLWINVEENMPVKHADSWYEDSDGVWRKHQPNQNS